MKKRIVQKNFRSLNFSPLIATRKTFFRIFLRRSRLNKSKENHVKLMFRQIKEEIFIAIPREIGTLVPYCWLKSNWCSKHPAVTDFLEHWWFYVERVFTSLWQTLKQVLIWKILPQRMITPEKLFFSENWQNTWRKHVERTRPFWLL